MNVGNEGLVWNGPVKFGIISDAEAVTGRLSDGCNFTAIGCMF